MDTGKPRKTCVDVAGRSSFRTLLSKQQSGYECNHNESTRPTNNTTSPLKMTIHTITMQWKNYNANGKSTAITQRQSKTVNLTRQTNLNTTKTNLNTTRRIWKQRTNLNTMRRIWIPRVGFEYHKTDSNTMRRIWIQRNEFEYHVARGKKP